MWVSTFWIFKYNSLKKRGFSASSQNFPSFPSLLEIGSRESKISPLWIPSKNLDSLWILSGLYTCWPLGQACSWEIPLSSLPMRQSSTCHAFQGSSQPGKHSLGQSFVVTLTMVWGLLCNPHLQKSCFQGKSLVSNWTADLKSQLWGNVFLSLD